MSTIYDVAGSYWVSVELMDDIDPQLDTDFIIIDEEPRFYPVYYVTNNKKLYLLFENKTNQFALVDLHINNDIPTRVLLHDQQKVDAFCGEIYPVGLGLSENSTNPPKKNIIDVLTSIPIEYNLPVIVKVKFLEKYN
nr:hypothetical protein [Abalone asfa-like virus]